MLNDPLIIINTAIAGSYFTISGVMFSKFKNNHQYVTKNTLILLIVGLFLASGVGHSLNIIQSLIDENMNTGLWSTLNILADVSVALGALIYIFRGNTKNFFSETESEQKRKLTVENNKLNRFNHLLETKVIECTLEMVKINEKLQKEIEGKERLTLELTTKNLELQQSIHKLATSEQKYRDVIENIKEVIFQTDARGNWQFLNPAWTEITGFSLGESLGNNSLNYIHPDDRKLCHLGWENMCKDFTEGEKSAFRTEIRCLTKNGEYKWMDVNGQLIFSEDNHCLIGMYGTINDIDQHKKVEEEMRHALEKEKELNELKTKFVSMASHEFRTPLTTILASSELLKYYGEKLTDRKKVEHFHRIESSVRNMTELLNYVLVIGKAEAGKLQFNPEPINLEEFCLNLVEEMQMGAGEKNQINFHFQDERVPHERESIHMDEKLLRHIFCNLLSNALKYSPDNINVYFDLCLQDEQAIFLVRDEGIGIPPEEQDKLFETFHRAKNVGNIPGTGLGLNVVKKCVELHEGALMVASDIGYGTTFRVTLPLNNQTTG